MIQDVLTCAVASYHRKVVHRLDTGTDSREEARRTRWRLGQQDSVAYPLLLDFGLYRLWQSLDKLPLHVFVALEVRERAFLSRDIRGCFISRVTNRAINALNHRHRCLAAIGNLHLDQRVGYSHRPQPCAPRTELRLLILFNKVFIGIDGIVQETHRYLTYLGQPLPIHLPFIVDEGRQVQRPQVADAPRRQALLTTI